MELDTLDFERKQATTEEVERKQNNAMHYVTSNIYAYSPVRVKRHNFKIYISLDTAAVRQQEFELKEDGKTDTDIVMGRPSQKGPGEVEIDEAGNIKMNYDEDDINARRDSVTGKRSVELCVRLCMLTNLVCVRVTAGNIEQELSYQEVCSNFVTPDPSDPPTKESSTTESITMKWEAPVIITKRVTHFKVDLYEVQYRPAQGDDVPPHAPHLPPHAFRTLTRSSHRQATLGRLDCAAALIFRVRSRNAFGWSDWSAESEVTQASADVPEVPQPPYPSIVKFHTQDNHIICCMILLYDFRSEGLSCPCSGSQYYASTARR